MKVNPGSDEAIKLGCTCPVMDNAHGRGAFIKDGQVMFWYSQDCPVHNDKTDDPGRASE